MVGDCGQWPHNSLHKEAAERSLGKWRTGYSVDIAIPGEQKLARHNQPDCFWAFMERKHTQSGSSLDFSSHCLEFGHLWKALYASSFPTYIRQLKDCVHLSCSIPTVMQQAVVKGWTKAPTLLERLEARLVGRDWIAGMCIYWYLYVFVICWYMLLSCINEENIA